MQTIYYQFDADIYCEDCARDMGIPEDNSFLPGETDCPQHCGACRVFLCGYSLTEDGEEYVIHTYLDWRLLGKGRKEVIQAWLERYDYLQDRARTAANIMFRLAEASG